MKTKRIAKLGAATVASGFLTAGVLGATTTAAQAVDQNIDVNQDYLCDVTVFPGGEGTQGLDLGAFTIGVNTRGQLPSNYSNGQQISSRNIDIDLTLPEDLRAASYNTVSGRSADGGSDDTFLTLRNSGQEVQVPVQNLASLAPVDIPKDVGAPFVVPAQGTVPQITAAGLGPTQVLVPASFTIDSTIYKAPNGTGAEVPTTLDCDVVTNTIGYRRGGVIQQDAQTPTGVVPSAGDVSVTAAPGKSTDVTLPDATDSDSDPATLLGYQAQDPEHGTLSGAGQDLVYTPDDGYTGTDTFTYTVSDQTGNTDTATVTIEVAKVSSKTTATAPKKVKAGKSVKITVKVTSDPAATGKVTAKLGKKTVASGNVKNGKATLTVPGKQTKKLKGKETFTVDYAGSNAVEGSSDKVKVTFTK